MSLEADPGIRVEQADGLAEVILNRPHRKNALTGPVVAELREAFTRLEADASVRAVLLRGEGGSFCAGLDLKEFNADPRPAWTATFSSGWLALHEQLYALSKPLVCALEAHAINAGAALALAADFCIAGDDAFLQVGEVRQGRPAPMNLAWLMLKHGDAVARRVALEGRRIVAAEFREMGLVTQVVPAAETQEAARTLARELAELPASGLALTRHLLRELNPRAGGESVFARAASIAAAAPSSTQGMASLKQ